MKQPILKNTVRVILLLNLSVSSVWGGETIQANVNSIGVPGNAKSFGQATSISENGRYVAFASGATNLVGGDHNLNIDIFVRDLVAKTTSIVSVDSTSVHGNRDSFTPSISADGRYVAFMSDSSNLVAGDINGANDIFVHDRLTKITRRLTNADSYSWSGSPIISADGRFVAFRSFEPSLVPGDTNGLVDVFVYDFLTKSTSRVSISSDGTERNSGYILGGGVFREEVFPPSISADGRYVAFETAANNLVTGDTNQTMDCFVHDRLTKVTNRVSVDSIGEQGSEACYQPKISADGRYVAFSSLSTNLVAGVTNGKSHSFLHDRLTKKTTLIGDVTSLLEQSSSAASISASGRYVALVKYFDNCVFRLI